MGESRGLHGGWNSSWSAGFDSVADAYDEARPGYPRELYRDLSRICDLDENTRTLEVGCGTGQATEDIAPLVGNVFALEPGEKLAKRARMRLKDFPNVEVQETTFEDFDGKSEVLDLITSATAFHWVEEGVGFVKAAELLRSGGWLALWWNVYHDPDGDDPFGDEVKRLLQGDAGEPGIAGMEYALRTEERISDFAKSPEFGDVQTRCYRWSGHHSAGEVRTLFSTYSNIQAVAEPERSCMLEGIEELANAKFGGNVTRPYVTALYAAQKAGK